MLNTSFFGKRAEMYCNNCIQNKYSENVYNGTEKRKIESKRTLPLEIFENIKEAIEWAEKILSHKESHL